MCFKCHSCVKVLFCLLLVFEIFSNLGESISSRNTFENIDGVATAAEKAQIWFHTQATRHSITNKWGVHVPRIGIALFLADPQYFSTDNATGSEIAYEITLRLLKSIFREQMAVFSQSYECGFTKECRADVNVERALPPNELALYLNALLASCINPRNFHGADLVSKLRSEVDHQSDFVNPFLLLSLCNAGDNMTQSDVDKLLDVFNNPLRPTWTNMRSLALMALSCVKQKHGESPKFNLTRLASEMKENATTNGSFDSVHSTALFIQALFASGEDESSNWNITEAIEFLLRNQRTDGSFGSLLNTYYVLPVLREKNLADIGANHCAHISDETNHDIRNVLQSTNIEQVQVKYSVVFDDEVTATNSIVLHIAVNNSVFDLMEMAAATNSRYRFKYVIEDSKPYVYEVDGVQDDPEYGKFWFLYKRNETSERPEPINLSPIDVMITEKAEFLMWYKTSNEILRRRQSS